MPTSQECCEQYWTSHGGSTPQRSSCMDTYQPSQKLSKLDESDMQDTAGEVGMSSCDVLLWTPSHGRAKAKRPARTYSEQLCADTGCCLEDLLEAIDDRERWRERVKDIRAEGQHDEDDYYYIYWLFKKTWHHLRCTGFFLKSQYHFII